MRNEFLRANLQIKSNQNKENRKIVFTVPWIFDQMVYLEDRIELFGIYITLRELLSRPRVFCLLIRSATIFF